MGIWNECQHFEPQIWNALYVHPQLEICIKCQMFTNVSILKKRKFVEKLIFIACLFHKKHNFSMGVLLLRFSDLYRFATIWLQVKTCNTLLDVVYDNSKLCKSLVSILLKWITFLQVYFNSVSIALTLPYTSPFIVTKCEATQMESDWKYGVTNMRVASDMNLNNEMLFFF